MKAGKGFTLVEILIVVMILAILGTVILPRFSNASQKARASMLADDLRVLRMQINVFKGQHLSVPPGYPDLDKSQQPTEAAFIIHMTKATTPGGNWAEPGTSGYRFGPYLREIPENPVNGKNTVQMIGDADSFPTGGDNSHGWIYQPSTMTIHADSPGTDEQGQAYFDY
ncbi:MAG: type II secretion system protein [Phycisphaerae bacterium]